MYPVLDDLLDDWRANFQPVFEGVRVVGHRWSADGHRVRDFLARNLIPYRWLDIETDAEAAELRALAGPADAPLPLVVLADGTRLSRPSIAELAERLGLHTQAAANAYDLVIVGAGPAGLAAAVYGASEGLRTLLIEREAPGGQAGTSSSIENYLGFPAGLSGGDLARRAVAQARRFGAEILAPMEAVGFATRDGYHIVTLGNGSTVTTQALLVATGVSYRLLDVPGAERLAGAGLFYGAAITEALTVKGQDVFVVGGGNSAGQGALYLARFARSVTLLVRGASLAETLSQYLVERIGEAENIQVRTHVAVSEVHGESSLEAVSVRDLGTGNVERLPARAVFVFIGAAPRTAWLNGALQVDAGGFVLSGVDLGARGGQAPARMARRARAVLAGDQHRRRLRRGGPAAPVHQAHRLRSGRRGDGRAVRAPAPARTGSRAAPARARRVLGSERAVRRAAVAAGVRPQAAAIRRPDARRRGAAVPLLAPRACGAGGPGHRRGRARRFAVRRAFRRARDHQA